MEKYETAAEFLRLIVRPAFTVRGGVIQCVNDAAGKYLLEPGMEISSMLITGAKEYATLQNGCLYLTLRIAELPCGASVSRMEDFDIFTLEQETDQDELQAMALAAQELRTPLANIMTVADRLFPTTQERTGLEQEQVARINRGLFQMLRIVSNMSDAYRYTQQVEPRLVLVDMRSLMDDIFSRLSPLLETARINLSFANMNHSVFSLANAEMLERAIHNILSNAVKFSGKGSQIEVKFSLKDDMFYLTVQDDGPGIADNLRGQVYSRFLRQPGLEDSRYGIGLGMVLIRSAAAAHNGTVLIEQSEKSGVRITMTMAYRQESDVTVRSSTLKVDYAGERDHGLVEFSDVLPVSLYESDSVN